MVVSRDVLFDERCEAEKCTDQSNIPIEITDLMEEDVHGVDVEGEMDDQNDQNDHQNDGAHHNNDIGQSAIDQSNAISPPPGAQSNEQGGDTQNIQSHHGPPQPSAQPLRPSNRVRKPPQDWWEATAALVLGSTPATFAEAVEGPECDSWMCAMENEMSSLHKKSTWTLVPRHNATNILTPKWVYRKKKVNDDHGHATLKFKARLCARGFQQVQGIDYSETFAPVVTFTSIRILLAMVAAHDLELSQMDVVTAFLNGDLDEEIYMEQPQGFQGVNFPNGVCKLQKALYGLKQGPRQWHAKMHTLLVGKLKFTSTTTDACFYIRHTANNIEAIALYVDDLLIAGSDPTSLATIKTQLCGAFEMKDLGEAKTYLGLEISRDRSRRQLFLGQQKYIGTVLQRFGMENCKPIVTPLEVQFDVSDENEPAGGVPYREAVGSLMYLMTGTRPDLAFAIRRLSQYVSSPCKHHWIALKRVLRYVRGTSDYGILYHGNDIDKLTLDGFYDADWGGSRNDRKSTAGYVFKMYGGAISWCSRKQSVVALSSTEAEYMSMCQATKEDISLAYILAHLPPVKHKLPVTVKVDNQGAICTANNNTSSRRTKHVDIQYHFIRDAVSEGKVKFEYCPTEHMAADVLTKALLRVQFGRFREMIGVRRE